MGLPARATYEYAGLANEYLNNIPIEKLEDFEVITEALKAIIEPDQGHLVPATLKDRITTIKEIIENPKEYVEKRKHDGEFKSIIMGRVAAKIQEIETLSLLEKQKYIEDQKALKEEVIRSHATMASRQPPAVGSESHTISEHEWLQQQQIQFQQGPQSNPFLRPINEISTIIQVLGSLSPDPIQRQLAEVQAAIVEHQQSGGQVTLEQMMALRTQMTEIWQSQELMRAFRDLR